MKRLRGWRKEGWFAALGLMACAACGGRADLLEGGSISGAAGVGSATSASAGTGSSAGTGTVAQGGSGPGLSGVAGGFSGIAGTAPASGGAPGGMTAPEPFMAPALDSSVASEATNLGLNAQHNNLQPNDSVTSPLHRIWTTTLETTAGAPLVAHGRVYVVTRDPSFEGQPLLYALRVDTGASLWGPVALGGGPEGFAYDQERLFTVDGNGNLSAYDASTGSSQWTIQLPHQWSFGSGPVASDGKVYVNGSGDGGTTYAVDEASGDILWQADTFDGSDGSVAVLGSRVYEAEACDQLSVFEVASGARDWFHQGNCTGGGGVTPFIYGNWIWEFDWAEGNIILDLGGNSHGSFSANQAIAFDQGLVFYQNNDVLSAVDIATSVQRWAFKPPSVGLGSGQLCFGPVVAGKNQRVFLPIGTGELVELDAATGKTISTDQLAPGTDLAGCVTGLALAEGHLFASYANQVIAY